jgi:hypothetical protein
MKTKIIPEQKINLYEFAELTPEIQQKVIENKYDINVDFEWWESIYEDAANIGLKITGFDIDRASYYKGQFINNATETAENIINEHGENCETYKTAKLFLEELNFLTLKYVNIEDCPENEIEEIEDYFCNSILEDYRIILQNEYEYLTSEKAIIETIKANEYLFTIDGEIESL